MKQEYLSMKKYVWNCYNNIHENIGDLKSRIKRLETIIMGNTVAVVVALISIFMKV